MKSDTPPVDALKRALTSGKSKELDQLLLERDSLVDPGILESLLEAGLPVDSVDGAGNTALHLAIEEELPIFNSDVHGQPEIAHQLDRMREDRIGSRLSRMWLMRADDILRRISEDRMASRKKCVELLLQYGSKASARNRLGESPLHLAVTCSVDPALVELLLTAGADCNAQDALGTTPLLLAARTSGVSVVGALLAAGADCNVSDEDGETPLLVAATRSDTLELVDSLVSHGARIDARSKRGKSVMHKAMLGLGNVKSFRRSSAFRFLELGAGINALDNDCRTPLHYAVRDADEATIEMLVRLGADVNARDRLGRSPLHEWAMHGVQSSSIGALLSGGAHVDIRDNFGQTPLHLAGKRCDSAKDDDGFVDDQGVFHEIPYDIFGERDFTSWVWDELSRRDEITSATEGVLAALLAAGADLRATDGDGRTPWQTATNRAARRRLWQAMTGEQGDESDAEELD